MEPELAAGPVSAVSASGREAVADKAPACIAEGFGQELVGAGDETHDPGALQAINIARADAHAGFVIADETDRHQQQRKKSHKSRTHEATNCGERGFK